jgi:hypothetical protein
VLIERPPYDVGDKDNKGIIAINTRKKKKPIIRRLLEGRTQG